jgi:PTS system mannose-specific IIB component
MKDIILISHGDLAQGMKQSLEMMIGVQKNIHVVSLRPGCDSGQFEKELVACMGACEADEIIIIADMLGGTPANVATKRYHKNECVRIFAGMNLTLLIELVVGQTADLARVLKSARRSIVDVDVALEEAKEQQSTPEALAEDTDQLQRLYDGAANIVHVRLDERLVHGQVATVWAPTLATQRIIVANDEAAGDTLQRNALRLATSQTMRLSVLPVVQAAKNIIAGKYGKQRIFLLFSNPRDVARFVAAGGNIERLNVGNMSYKTGTKEVVRHIQVLPEEVEIFQSLAKTGMDITAQLVPNEPVVDFMLKLAKK